MISSKKLMQRLGGERLEFDGLRRQADNWLGLRSSVVCVEASPSKHRRRLLVQSGRRQPIPPQAMDHILDLTAGAPSAPGGAARRARKPASPGCGAVRRIPKDRNDRHPHEEPQRCTANRRHPAAHRDEA